MYQFKKNRISFWRETHQYWWWVDITFRFAKSSTFLDINCGKCWEIFEEDLKRKSVEIGLENNKSNAKLMIKLSDTLIYKLPIDIGSDTLISVTKSSCVVKTKPSKCRETIYCASSFALKSLWAISSDFSYKVEAMILTGLSAVNGHYGQQCSVLLWAITRPFQNQNKGDRD